MKSYQAMFGAWILWRVILAPALSGPQAVTQVWLPERSFATYVSCQQAEDRLRNSLRQQEGGVVKVVCMPDSFVPPQQEPSR